jgi:Mrp family chromosome partitioning ATPase
LLTDRPAEATPNDRWQAEPDEPWADRPGIIASLLRYRLIVVAAALLAAVAGYGMARLLPVQYQAQASMVLSDPGGPSILGGGNPLSGSDRQVYLAKQVAIMNSSLVLQRALQLLGGHQSLQDARDRLNVQASKDLAGITIGATGGDPRSAAALANAVGDAYELVTADRVSQDAQRAVASMDKLIGRLQEELDASPKSPDGRLTARQQQLAGRITDLQQQQQDITTQVAVSGSGVELFEQADRPTSPTQPKPKLAVALGALLGLLGAGTWAWWAAARYQRAEERGDPARILGAPLLGEVPQLRARPWSADGPAASPPALEPSAREAYHFVVASLDHELASVGGSAVAVTSVGRGDRTTTALNVANAAWEENRKVLLIDADERTRRLSKLCGHGEGPAPNGHATPAARGEPADPKEYLNRLILTRSVMVLPVTPNGGDPGYPTTSLRGPDVRQALLSIGELFDLVLIDTPELLATSDALNIAGKSDGVVLVVNHGVLLDQLRDVRKLLAFVKAPLLGYVYVRPRGLGVRAQWQLATWRLAARRRGRTGDVHEPAEQ